MSMRRWNAVVVMMALVGASACRIERTPRAEASDPQSVARAEIELTLRTYQEALLASDARQAAAVFTPTAHVYLPDTPEIHGRGLIDEFMANRFANETVEDMILQLDQIDVGAGVAHQFGQFQQRVRDPDGVEREIDARFAIRWVRASDAAWRIDRLLVNHAPVDSTVSPQS